MLSKGRVTAPALATLALAASLVVTGCASRSGTGVSTAGHGPGPAGPPRYASPDCYPRPGALGASRRAARSAD